MLFGVDTGIFMVFQDGVFMLDCLDIKSKRTYIAFTAIENAFILYMYNTCTIHVYYII